MVRKVISTLDASWNVSKSIQSIDNSITTKLKNRIRMRLMLRAIKRKYRLNGTKRIEREREKKPKPIHELRYQVIHSVCVFVPHMLSSLLFRT